MFFSVFSTRRYPSNHIETSSVAPETPFLASSKRTFLAKKQQRQEVIHLRWHVMGTFETGCFHPSSSVWPPFLWGFLDFFWRFNSIQHVVYRFIHVGQSKKSFKPSGGTHLEGTRAQKKDGWMKKRRSSFDGEKIWGKNMKHISQGFTMFQWFNLMRLVHHVISHPWESLWEASTVAVADNSFWSKATTWWVWHGESTWNLPICDSCDLFAFSHSVFRSFFIFFP